MARETGVGLVVAGPGFLVESWPVRDGDCIDLLRWASAELGLREEGFRRVRGQVCRRVTRRIVALGLDGLTAYRAFVAATPGERAVLEALCRVHVSRFYRDRAVFDALRDRVLPALAAAAGRGPLRLWSAGCAAGEEPYTLALVWHFAVGPRFSGLPVEIVGTDADQDSLDRAGGYPTSSLKELPRPWREAAFEHRQGRSFLTEELRARVALRCQDLRTAAPAGPFHLILCRNMAFTYFAPPLQRTIAARLAALLVPGGALLVGRDERLPAGAVPLKADQAISGLFWSPRP
jgi:chemotaxis protein methyltransferase CheR